MLVNTKHPEITAERTAEWELMRDAMGGESEIKKRGEVYLTKPSGFKSDPSTEGAKYDAYRSRAQFPEILAPSVAAMMGIIHGAEIQIEMPDQMGFLTESADGHGLPLESFHRRITRALLIYGRFGVLADAPEGGGDPYLVGYAAGTVINWDTDFWVLDESGLVRDGFAWKQVEKYRVLTMEGAAYAQTLWQGGVAVPIEVRARGGNVLPRIPFAVANAMETSPEVKTPPLIGVARAAKAIYQLSADYRWQLYMSGQETLVAINGTAPAMVGAGVVHSMMGAEGVTPDLKYVSPSCSGIEAHLKAMEDNRTSAIQAGARLLEQSDSVQESGEARKLRFASETATLTSIAQSSCALLERALRDVAMIMGLSEEDVVVTPPKDLLDNTMTPADLAALFGIYERGGMAWETYYERGQAGGIFSPERDAKQEFALVDGLANEDGTAL